MSRSDVVGVLGVAGERRVRLFTEAAERARMPVEVIDWHHVLDAFEAAHPSDGASPSTPSPTLDLTRLSTLRIDSSGEDPRAEDRLRAIGGLSRPLAHAEVGGWQEWARGLTAVTSWLCQGPAAHLTTSTTPADLGDLFDKRATHRRLRAAGVPVPAPGPEPDDLCSTPGRWFLKPAHGSSGSGVVAVSVRPDRVQAWAPVVVENGVPFNHLRLQRYTGDEVRQLVDLLARRGPLQVERWYPKAALETHALDLRIVVVDHVARTVVARGSHGPMTNLHLGNRRLDVDVVAARAGALWDEAARTAEAAAAAFPQTRCVGVDVLLSSSWDACVVGEVNAFGDLLPGALHQGRDTYDWQVAGLLTPHRSSPSVATSGLGKTA